ncbi:MAG: L-histidine N(alpha)-methyltransferase [Bacteroidota bacterium]
MPDTTTTTTTTDAAFLADVVAGLSTTPKTLPCKYFYDERGSALFDQITELDAYYPTRTEAAIMAAHVEAMAEAVGPRAALVEYGSGSSEKTRRLLAALPDLAAYVPIDISGDYLQAQAERLRQRFPETLILPVAADFTAPFALPALPPDTARRVVYFPGSTIGNFAPGPAVRLLRQMADVAGPSSDGRGGGLLIGADLVKDRDVLVRAYDDPEGVTAAFNLNLLARINRDLGGTFDLDAFRHEARWNEEDARIEMHLVSERAQTVHVGTTQAGGGTFRFAAGESIHTENSHKYTLDGFARLAGRAGWTRRRVWTDPAGSFSVQYFEATAPLN